MIQQLGAARVRAAARRAEARQQNRKAADAGFTLIELLIVIVILGILAAVVVFSVRGITDRGQESACNTTASTITSAAQAYYAQTQAGDSPSYPTDVATLVTDNLLASTPTMTFGTYTVSYDNATGVATCGAGSAATGQ